MTKTMEEFEQIIDELQQKVKALEDRIGITEASGVPSEFYMPMVRSDMPPSHEARLKNLERRTATGIDAIT
jgi:uncharacterized coiled-coil protein SlyX